MGLDWELRQQRGDAPNAKEYETRFPDYRNDIREIAAAPNARSVLSSVKVASAETSKGPTGARPGQTTDSQVVNSLGRFEILSVLGEGAFGTVYKAHDPQLDRDVAIKVPRFGAMQSAEDRERFLREARAAASLHHAQICPVHEVGTIDNRDYIVMAYIDGKPLSKVIQTQGKLSDKQIVSVIRKLALALQEAHDKGIIHRDLKPANIMINRKGEPVIMDFGLARRDNSGDAQISQSGQIMGTPAYMSPEQARGDGKLVGPAADIYSLGVVLYELLCGRRPYEGTITEVIGQILHVPAEPPSAHRPDIDSRLEQICLKAIAKKSTDRYASMKDFAAALAEFLKDPSAAAAESKLPAGTAGSESVSTDRQKLAQQFIQQGQLPAALEALEPLLSSRDKSQSAWAKQESAKLQADIQKWEDQAPSLISLSHKLMRKHDYTEAKKLLLQVPVSLRMDEMQEILRDAEDKEQECDLLLMEIETALRKEHAKELPGLVKRFLQLKPGHKEMRKLAEDLKQYGAEKAIKIRKGHRSFDAAGAIWNWKTLAAVAGGFAALVLGVYFAVIAFSTPNGWVVVNVEDPAIVVSINGNEATFDDHGKKFKLKATETGTIAISVNGVEIDTGNEEITVKKKETKQLTAKLLPEGDVELSFDGIVKVFTVSGKAPGENIAASDGVRFASPPRRVELAELNTGRTDAYPWVSTDGKRIYWESASSEPNPHSVICVAERPDAQSPFTGRRELIPGRHPTLTGDELEMIYLGSAGGVQKLYRAQRDSLGESFSVVGEIPELRDQVNPKSPVLSEDGRLLIFQRTTAGKVEFVSCSRSDRNSAWGNPSPLKINPDPNWIDPITWPFISADGLTLWYCHGGDKTPDIRTATRPGSQAPFDNHQPVIVEGTPLIGRSPRYVAATNELFYSAIRDEKTGDWSLWVVKDYRPGSTASAAPTEADWITLFDGKDLSNWIMVDGKSPKWKVENGYMEVVPGAGNLMTGEKFPLDFELHMEFWLPRKPGHQGQHRANSGVFLLGRYEIQILDGFQNEVKPDTACGALYGQITPTNNVFAQPETWQTYDITLHAPSDYGNGNFLAPGRLTVMKNGTKIIDDAAFDTLSPGWQNNDVGQPGPIMLQDHGSPVRFRNIRLRPLNAAADSDDLAKWQGKWVGVAENSQGKDRTPDEVAARRHKINIEGNRRSVERIIAGKLQPYSGTFRLNPNASPKEFDFDFDGVNTVGGQRGLYEFVGDRLRLIYRSSDTAKPQRAQWSDKGKPNVLYFEFERQEDGWIDLFNGKDLTGWQGAVNGHEVVNGVLRSKPNVREVLYTTREFDDFIVQLEFKLSPGSNNGLAIRYPGSGDPAYTGMCEIQILDPGHPNAGKLAPSQHHGSAFGMAAAQQGRLKPVGEWNFQQVTVRGSKIRVELNGSVILETDLANVNKFLNNAPHPGKDRKRGYFGFYPINSVTEFRNIRIRPLTNEQADGFVPLFNGKDLTGWKMPPGSPENPWKVENGLLTAERGLPMSMLVTERGDYRDVHVRAEALWRRASGNQGSHPARTRPA